MLVLGRRQGESIAIQTPLGEITVTLVRPGQRYARIGIEAPAGWPIVRSEIRGREEPADDELPTLASLRGSLPPDLGDSVQLVRSIRDGDR